MARHYARELALRVLFECDLAKTAVEEVLSRTVLGATQADRDYAQTLVQGTLEHRGDLDTRIDQAASKWRLERMPPIDRNILRLGSFELLYEPEVPISVIIDEAVELAQSYSTLDAKKFVNGVLGSIAREVRPQGDTDRL